MTKKAAYPLYNVEAKGRWIYIYEIYIDSLFLTNFLMDLLAVYLTGVFLKRKIRLRRLVLSSVIGSAAGILLFLVMKDYGLYVLCVHLAVNPIMIWIAYGRKRKWDILKNWLLCYGFMMLTGGIMQWVNRSVFHREHLYASILITAAVSLIFTMVWEKSWVMGKNLYHVVIEVKGNEVSTEAYFDSGNLVTDPYIGKPVSIVNRELLQAVLEKEEMAVRYIPFQSLGTENGLLPAVSVERIQIEKGTKKICIEPAVIGFANKSLFQNKEYQMILNGRLMHEL